MCVAEKAAVIIHWVAGNVDAHGLLFQIQHLTLTHFGELRDGNGSRLVLILQQAEQADLALQILLPGGGNGIHHPVVHRQQFTAMVAEAVHGAAFDEVFHGPLVDLVPHTLGEVLQGFKGTALFPLGAHSTDKAVTHILHSAQTEADGITVHGELVLGVVHIRRQDRNTHILALCDIAGDFGCGIQD